jgi:hypothetical protein
MTREVRGEDDPCHAPKRTNHARAVYADRLFFQREDDDRREQQERDDDRADELRSP